MQLVGQRPAPGPTARSRSRHAQWSSDRLRGQLGMRLAVAAFSLALSVTVSVVLAAALRLAG